MSTLRISDAPLLPDVNGTEKIPTGGRGDYAISVDQIKDHIFQDVGKELVGLGNVDNTSDLDKPVSTAQQAALNLKADKTYVDENLDLKADKTSVYTRSETSLALSKKADLVNGVVPENQIPSSFNDVLEFTTPNLPIIGESGKIYVTTDTNRTWRWSGNQYVEVSNGGISDSTQKLQTPRKIANVDFDGTQNIEIPHNNLKNRDVIGAHSASAIQDVNGKTQQEINDEIIYFVHSIDNLRDYKPSFGGQIVKTAAYHPFTQIGGSSYIYDAVSVDDDDGFTRIKTSKATGCFKLIEQDQYSIAQLGAQNNDSLDSYVQKFISCATTYNLSRKLILEAMSYTATEALPYFTSNLKITGQGAQTIIKYVGADNGVLFKASNAAGTASAISTVLLSDVFIDMNFVEGATALQVIYATNESKFEKIQISNIGINGCGVDTSKLWYTFFDNIRVSNPSSVKQGIGLKVRSIAGDNLSQVNGISYNGFRIGRMDIGVLFDSTSAAHYSLGLFGEIEGCNIGVKHIGTLGVVRMDTFIHYEGNTINIEWGAAGKNVSTTGLINWNGYANSGDFRFNQNHHDVKIRTVPSVASVYMTGSARVAWLGQATGNLEQVNYPGTSTPLIDFKERTLEIGRKESTQIYATPDASYGKVVSHRYLHASGSSTTTDLNNFVRILANKTFLKVEFICIRHSDGAYRQFSGMVVRREDGVWNLRKLAGNDFDATFTLEINNNGIITHTGNYDLEVCVLITPC